MTPPRLRLAYMGGGEWTVTGSGLALPVTVKGAAFVDGPTTRALMALAASCAQIPAASDVMRWQPGPGSLQPCWVFA